MGAAISKPARRGRPPLTPGEAKRAAFNTRLRNTLKEQLEEAARSAGRSLSEEIESRLERSFDRTAALGGPEYEALFQMMAAAARVIEVRLGKSPFSNPEASAVARNAWRQIVHSVTSNPLEGVAVKESLRITDEMTDLEPPKSPNLNVYGGLGGEPVPGEQKARELENRLVQYQREKVQYDHQMQQYRQDLRALSKKLIEFADVANEAAMIGLSFPKHR